MSTVVVACSASSINEVERNVFVESSRINSTFGGNLVDMVRFQRVLDDTGVQAIFNFSNETVFVPEAEIGRSIVGVGDSSNEFNGALPSFHGALYYSSARDA